jgi:hypothetical protein
VALIVANRVRIERRQGYAAGGEAQEERGRTEIRLTAKNAEIAEMGIHSLRSLHHYKKKSRISDKIHGL